MRIGASLNCSGVIRRVTLTPNRRRSQNKAHEKSITLCFDPSPIGSQNVEPIHTQSTYLRTLSLGWIHRDLRRDHCVGLASVGSEKHRDLLHFSEALLLRRVQSARLILPA